MTKQLIQLIQQRIVQQGGAIPFADYMHTALYTPEWGYYTSNRCLLGKQGDFVTAPEISPLFGQCLAQAIAPIMHQLTTPNILEFGAGTGKLCIDVLRRLEQLNALPEHYCILEVSAYLKAQQQQAIEHAIPHLTDKVRWLTHWPERPFEGVILANEVLDAMPVHRFKIEQGEILESHISIDSENALKESFKPCTNLALLNKIATLSLPQDNYRSEVNLLMDEWIRQCYQCLNKGCAFIIDYGFVAREYYHPDRTMGTLMCHHQQRSNTNPLLLPGEQDITAHVDFTALAHAAQKSGWHVCGFTNQASFLIAHGLLSLLEAVMAASSPDSAEYLTASQQTKLLTSPAEMGELFKVMTLSKAMKPTIDSIQDLRFRL